MLHAAIRTVPGTLAFRTWREAGELWDRVTSRVPCQSASLMPDHLHLNVLDEAQLARLADALRSYAQWRNRARGERGPVFRHGATPSPIRDREHLIRTQRYIHLNPCRAKLVSDPLAWPFSTHRDAVGLALSPVIRPAADPARFHAFVSGDPTAHPNGTLLPGPPAAMSPLSIAEVHAAVSSLARITVGRLKEAGPARSLFIRAARVLTAASAAEIAAAAGVAPSTVRRHEATADAQTVLIARVAGDPRFFPLPDVDLRTLSSWQRYRHLR
jgi:hypothetical protein